MLSSGSDGATVADTNYQNNKNIYNNKKKLWNVVKFSILPVYTSILPQKQPQSTSFHFKLCDFLNDCNEVYSLFDSAFLLISLSFLPKKMFCYHAGCYHMPVSSSWIEWVKKMILRSKIIWLVAETSQSMLPRKQLSENLSSLLPIKWETAVAFLQICPNLWQFIFEKHFT